MLEGWASAAIELARRGIGNLKVSGALTRMPYWLALLADLHVRDGRPDAARATLDAALVDGRTRDDVRWLPEVLRARAGYDETEPVAVGRLRAAAAMTHVHGSAALLRRWARSPRRCGAARSTSGRRSASASPM